MMMFVSRNALAFTRLIPVESEAGRQRTPQSAQSLERLLAPSVSRNFETARPRDRYLDFITFLELQGFHHDAWKANRETVPPLGDLHRSAH
jgi:hypothetical protein